MQESTKINIQFFFQKKTTLLDRKRLKQFLANKLSELGRKKSGELRIIFCSDEELLKINRDYLQHDYYTDIITFPFTDSKGSNIDAELYISIDRVRDNARNQSVSFATELLRVIFHGVLHLCGFGDKTQKEIAAMRNMEELLLQEYFKNVPHNTVSP